MNITVKSVSELTLPVPPPYVQRRLGDLLDAAAEQRRTAIEAAEKSYSIALQIDVDRMSRLDSQGGEG